jgi:hypothetical protein
MSIGLIPHVSISYHLRQHCSNDNPQRGVVCRQQMNFLALVYVAEAIQFKLSVKDVLSVSWHRWRLSYDPWDYVNFFSQMIVAYKLFSWPQISEITESAGVIWTFKQQHVFLNRYLRIVLLLCLFYESCGRGEVKQLRTSCDTACFAVRVCLGAMLP